MVGIKSSPVTWHKRLGHPNHQLLHRILKTQQLLMSKLDFLPNLCISCQLAKRRQLPFNNSQHVTTSPLEIIHSDIWTSPVLSISGCKFYLVLVDDFSRYSWIFPLKHKSDTFACFVKFKCLLENLLSTKIKKFQTDGGGEFSSIVFEKYLTNNGILHQKRCPHTS